MLYALLGSILVGVLGSALLAWRKARSDGELGQVKAELTHARQSEARAVSELLQERADRADEKLRTENQLLTIRTQRDEALAKLATTGAPGSIADLLRTHNVP
jgi:hypothetical protein